MPEVISFGPDACEGVDDILLRDVKRRGILGSDVALFPDGKGWLLAEFSGETKEEALEKAEPWASMPNTGSW